ncbi:hypothetical protein LSAT2_009892 [Lamellibrachia satsuma]|nr:hypothetical protein LSAT2_009892 [Lamellibrachia satsuma]
MPVTKPYLLLDDVNSELDYPLLSNEDMMDSSDEDVLVNSIEVGAMSHQTTTDFGGTTGASAHKLNGSNTSKGKNSSSRIPMDDTVACSHASNTAAETVVQMGIAKDMSRQISEEEVTFFNRYDIETEETMKCIVTSIMFIVIVVTIIIVAFVVNPQV